MPLQKNVKGGGAFGSFAEPAEVQHHNNSARRASLRHLKHTALDVNTVGQHYHHYASNAKPKLATSIGVSTLHVPSPLLAVAELSLRLVNSYAGGTHMKPAGDTW